MAFARVRELLGFGAAEIEIDDGATAEVLWERLVYDADDLAALRDSTRFARNGELIAGDVALADGDELALMPPVGGG